MLRARTRARRANHPTPHKPNNHTPHKRTPITPSATRFARHPRFAHRQAEYFVFDANPTVGRLRKALSRVGDETMVVFEPTSYSKAGVIAKAGLLKRVNVMTPNGAEVIEMGKALGYDVGLGGDDEVEGVADMLLGEMAEAAMILVTKGEKGVLAITKDGSESFPPPFVSDVVNSTAAGDSFLGGFITNLYARNGLHTMDTTINLERKDSKGTLEEAIVYGMRVAGKTVGEEGGVKKDYGELRFHEVRV
jgi:hypothetical protein